MLAVKRSAGVAPEVDLRNPLYAYNKAHKQGIHSGYETVGKCHHKSKTGVPYQKYWCPPNFLKIKIKKLNIALLLNTLDGIGPSIYPKHCLG